MPLLLRSVGKAPVFTMREAAQFLSRPGEDSESVHNRLKGLTMRRLIHRRFYETAHYYGLDDLATAEVLFASGARGEVADTVSRACYAWDRTVNPRPAYIRQGVSPIAAAMIGAGDQGQSWALRTVSFHDEAIGQRVIVAVLQNTDIAPANLAGVLPPSFSEEFESMLQITRLLLRFQPALREAVEDLNRQN